MTRPEALLFDVNETLLDLTPVKKEICELLGSQASANEWFARLLHASLVANELDAYRPFGQIGVEQLLAIAKRLRIGLTESKAREVVGLMAALPPHPDVVDGLESLAAAGLKLATLTNGSADMVTQQLHNAGLDGLFEASLSVSSVGRFKPAPEVYTWAVDRLGSLPQHTVLVAAHDWDVAGAMRAGLRGAFVAREGATWSLPWPLAEHVVPDLVALARAL